MDVPRVIATGDPAGKAPASYSRFLLPFSYRKQGLESGASGPRFVPIDPTPGHRRQYLTFETADVLYERARWFELRENGVALGCNLRLFRPTQVEPKRALPVYLSAPRLVLFEWPAARGEPDPFSTGFLSLELSFPESAVSLNDFCFVNELFRYWMRPFPKHPRLSSFERVMREAPAKGGTDPYFDRWAYLLNMPCQLEGRYFELVTDEDQKAVMNWIDHGTGKSGWMVYSDARAYTWTCAVVPGGGDGLAESRAWTQLLNVDPPGWGELTEFEKGWTKERTYSRWVEGGSLYGFTVHSGAALLPPCTEPPLWQHFGGSYFAQTLLLLYTRVTLFRFSRWLGEVSANARNSGSGLRDPELETQLSRIRKCLTLFANLYQFPLLSNQQQGIEMYVLARKVMDIQELADELQSQSQGSHELLDMLADQEEAKAARRLSLVAAVGLPFALATGFLGMNFISQDLAEGKSPEGLEWAVALISLLVSAALVVSAYFAIDLWRLAKKRFRSGKEKRAL